MSTLKVNTIQNTSGGSSSTPEQIESGRAKSFVTFNSRSSTSILHSFNVSSVTDNGTGDHNVNFATAHSDADYAIAGTAVTSSGNENSVVKVGPRASTNSTNLPLTKTTTQVRIRVGAGTTEMDAGNVYMVTYD